MLDNVYTAIADGVTAEAPKLAIAAGAIIAIRFGLPFALSIYRRLAGK